MSALNPPKLGITMGDPAGIGPEIAVKAFSNEEVHHLCRPLIIGDAAVIEMIVRLLGLNFSVHRICEIQEARFSPGVIDVLDLANVDQNKLVLGEVSVMAGEAAFQAVRKAIELALSGEIDGTVTSPINKEALNKAGHHFSGHTEIYAHFTGSKKYAMLLVDGDFRVVHVSTHVSLRTACNLVKKQRIVEVIELLDDACLRLGISSPKIGVAGLNPHASDGGLFGKEELKEILPAVEEARKRGMNVEGPVPPDTLFAKAAGGFYDGCVAMYHDQGHIPFKLLGFEWDNRKGRMKSVRGVNITLGLPIIRTSVDHGTAFEIAGMGVASPDAMILAIKYAAQLAENRDRNSTPK